MRAEFFYHRLDSTTSEYERLQSSVGERDRLVVRAAVQDAGKGRGDNGWYSPEGGLWLTFDLISELEIPSFALFIGACVHRCLSRLFPLTELRIKWPNDLYHRDQKLAGILCSHQGNRYVAGLGLNTTLSRDLQFDECKAAILTEIMGFPVSNRYLADLILAEVELQNPCLSQPEKYIAYCNSHLYGLHKEARLVMGEREFYGTVQELTPRGHLALSLPDGSLVTTPWGTLTMR